MNTRRILRIVGAMVALSLVVVGVAYAFGVGNVDGVWETVEDGGGADCDGWATVGTPGVPDKPIDAIGAQVGTINYPTATDQRRERLATVCSGDEGDDTFAEWTSGGTAVWTGLGSYTGCATAASLIFSEYVYDSRSSNPDYLGIEIYNGTGAAVNLSQYSLRLYTSSYQYTPVALNSVNLANGDVYVLVTAAAAGQTNQEDQTITDSESYRTIVLFKEGVAQVVTTWSGTNPGVQTGSTTDENQVRYGEPASLSACPSNGAQSLLQSGFGFDGVNGVAGLDSDEPFYLGRFTHYNNPIYQATNAFSWVDLAITVPIDCGSDGVADTNFVFYPRFALDETTNSDNPCEYPTGPNTQGCSDQVLVTQPSTSTFVCEGVGEYTVNILGFTTNEDCETVYDANASATEFLTRESFTNGACLWANISAPTADASVLKACDGFPALDPHYVVTVINEGPGVALGAKIVDVLPSGVTFASYTSQRTVGGVTTSQGTCTAVGQTVTCNLNAALPATTGDATAKWVVNINADFAAVQNPSFSNTVTLTTTSVDNNSANNTAGAICEVPTAVELSSFEATGAVRSVELTWETTSETNNLGFNIYRAPKVNGKKTKVNKVIIPSGLYPGAPGGATYSYTDKPLPANWTFYYWLEDVDTNGQTVLRGPVSATTLAVPKKK